MSGRAVVSPESVDGAASARRRGGGPPAGMSGEAA